MRSYDSQIDAGHPPGCPCRKCAMGRRGLWGRPAKADMNQDEAGAAKAERNQAEAGPEGNRPVRRVVILTVLFLLSPIVWFVFWCATDGSRPYSEWSRHLGEAFFIAAVMAIVALAIWRGSS